MARYAIGDVQGCFDSLMALLEAIHFEPKKDELWFAGDLVNRGPKSLETLRFIKQLSDSALADDNSAQFERTLKSITSSAITS